LPGGGARPPPPTTIRPDHIVTSLAEIAALFGV
jgi:hypothetical protein